MSETKSKSSKLPPKGKEKVIDVSLKHLLVGAFVLAAGAAVAGSTIIIIKDYSKYKRQKAILDTTIKLIEYFQPRPIITPEESNDRHEV